MSGINLMVLGTFGGATDLGPYWDVEKLYYNPPGDKRYALNNSGWLPVVGKISDTISGISDTAQRGIFLGGTVTNPRVFIIGATGDKVYSYRRSSLWGVAGDPSSDFDVTTFDVSSQTTSPFGLFFKPDGTKMWVGNVTNNTILQYGLSTAWDITSASYEKNVSVSAQVTSLSGFAFNSIGSLIVVVDGSDDQLYRFENPNFWDITDTYYADDFIDVTTQDSSPTGVSISADGIHLYVVGTGGDKIYHYEMDFGNTLSTAVYKSEFSLTTDPYGLWMDPTGRYFGYLRASYTADNYVVALGSYSASSYDTALTGVFISPDGGKLYVTGSAGDTIEQFGMSPAYSFSTIEYEKTQSVSAADTVPRGLFFKSDGTKLFFCGDTGNVVESYDLGTAWDIATITNNTSFSVSAKFSVPRGVYISPDGTKMFVCGSGSVTGGYGVAAYALSTAWDITSASHVADLNTSAATVYDVDPRNVTFSNNGKRLHVGGSGLNPTGDNNVIVQFELATAWDLTSITTYKKSGVGDLVSTMEGFCWEGQGTGLWMVSGSNIYKFTIDAS